MNNTKIKTDADTLTGYGLDDENKKRVHMMVGAFFALYHPKLEIEQRVVGRMSGKDAILIELVVRPAKGEGLGLGFVQGLEIPNRFGTFASDGVLTAERLAEASKAITERAEEMGC